MATVQNTVEVKAERLQPERITATLIDFSRKQLDDILVLSEQYGVGIKTLLQNYPSLEASLKLQYNADLEKLNETVHNLVEKVHDKINLLLNPPSTGSELGSTPQQAPANEMIFVEHRQGPTRAESVATKSAIVAKAVVK